MFSAVMEVCHVLRFIAKIFAVTDKDIKSSDYTTKIYRAEFDLFHLQQVILRIEDLVTQRYDNSWMNVALV